jgi:hypothetical protein
MKTKELKQYIQERLFFLNSKVFNSNNLIIDISDLSYSINLKVLKPRIHYKTLIYFNTLHQALAYLESLITLLSNETDLLKKE